MSGLKPCPFCGGDPILRDPDMWPTCSVCLCEGPGLTFGMSRKRAVTLWNTRAAPDWQDISTAPRDETSVLIGLGDTIAIGWFCPGNVGQLPRGWVWEGEDRWFREEPTHWMPLPAPPKEVG